MNDAPTADPTPPPRYWRAVVRPTQLSRVVRREIVPTTGPLATWVAHIWSLAWLGPVPSTLSAVISHPAVHLTLEAGPPGEVRHGHQLPAALLHGVNTRRFAPDLPAHGWVVGLHLTPGAIFDLTGVAAYRFTDRVLPWDQVYPGWNLNQVWDCGDPLARAYALRRVATATLRHREPSPDGWRARRVEKLARVAFSESSGGEIVGVDDLAEQMAISVRGLQRLCRTHLGVGPGWLLRRARVLRAHELLSTTELGVAEIAAELGWYDQAHLTRDYTLITGVAPVRLRREPPGSPTEG